MKTGITLMEMMVVIVIIGILATLSVTHYAAERERAVDRQAESDLRLIQSAQRIFLFENDRYFQSTPDPGGSHVPSINTNLLIFLPSGANRDWECQTFANNAVVPRRFCAQAIRTGGARAGRTWCIDENIDRVPLEGGRCGGASNAVCF